MLSIWEVESLWCFWPVLSFLLGLKMQFSFPWIWRAAAQKGYFRKERSCLAVFPEHWNDVAASWRRPFGCTRLFFNRKSSAEQSFAESGKDRNYFFWSQCLPVHTVDWRSCHTDTKSLSSWTPIFSLHIHFLYFILKPSWALDHQLGLFLKVQDSKIE